ncbi:MAG: glycosyltransferase [Thermoleophilia bacterium]
MTKVAFISFHLKARDSVSAEAEKWIGVFEEWGCNVHRVAGYIHEPGINDHVIPALNHLDPEVESFTVRAFSRAQDHAGLDGDLAGLSQSVADSLLPVLTEIAPDIIVADNVFSLPLNIPLSVVLCRFILEENIACIAVHHDFYWERPDFAVSAFGTLVASHFPAPLPQARHVTVSSQAREELYRRTGISATCIRNCFDFEAVRGRDDFNAGLRRDLGIEPDEVFFLQPTRAVERKGIKRAIRFVEAFNAVARQPCRLVVTGACDDGHEDRFRRMCQDARAELLYVPNWLGRTRGSSVAASPYDIHDAYAHCDMVVFPSEWEGFGNPVLESVVHRKLLLVADYPVLKELRAFGFQFLNLDDHAVDRTIKMMEYPALMAEMADRNFEIGKKHFSLDILRDQLSEMVSAAVFQ